MKQNIRSPIKITVISSENETFAFALMAGWFSITCKWNLKIKC